MTSGNSNDETIRVVCRECRFEKEVAPDDDALPAEYITKHGEETGHTVGIEYPEE